MRFEQFKRAFELSRITLKEDTLECTFVYLLNLSNGILEISKEQFISFVNKSKEKAFTYTMSGMTFPNEADLFDFSLSAEEQSQEQKLEHDVDLDDGMKALAGTTKSDPLAKTQGEA